MTAHNHIYARSKPLGLDGSPVAGEKGGVRYFITGGGGAPLYDIKGTDPRFAKALTVYHFVYWRLTPTSAFFWTIDPGGRVLDSGCFDKGSAVDVLDVVVDDPESVDKSVAAMEDLGIPSVSFMDWRKRNASFFSVLQVERNMMFIILSIIVIVAAFNIISGLIMLVKDKGREIGILRTMGATQGAIMRVFLITGASIGVVGTLAGFLLAVVFCWRIERLSALGHQSRFDRGCRGGVVACITGHLASASSGSLAIGMRPPDTKTFRNGSPLIEC